MPDDRDSWTQYAQQQGLLRQLFDRMAPAAAPAAKPRNKHHAERIQIDGRWFASKKEGARYQELKARQQAKQIDQLELQPAFPLHVMELYRSSPPIQITQCGTYHADFRYRDLQTGEIITEDVKGPSTRTEAYRLRKRFAETIHGFTVVEI